MAANDELQAYFGARRDDLVRFAALQLREQSLAEDVVQETLIGAVSGPLQP